MKLCAEAAARSGGHALFAQNRADKAREVSARQLRFLLVPPHAEYDAADQESLAQIAKAQLVVQSPEHHERDDVARLLSPIQPAATALVKLLATRAALNPSVSLRRVRSNAPSRPSIRTSGTAFPACARSECPIPYRPPSPIRRTPSLALALTELRIAKGKR